MILQMGRDLEEALQQQVAQPANSCVSESGVSFIDQVIRPLYEVICAVCPIIEFLFPVIMQRTININILVLEVKTCDIYSKLFCTFSK